MSNILTIPIAKIKESKSNPRKTFDTKSLQELADSIKAQGVLQPPLVRPKGKNFELVCGARRYRASILAGLTELDVYVREMSDEQVLDAQIVENLQREDVHPLEEAECIQKLLDSKLYDSPQAVADKIGRPVRFVLLRMKLTTLHQSVKKALEDGEIGIGWAELAATLEESLQAKALAESRSYYGPKTVSELRKWIASRNVPLKQAHFSLKDKTLYPEMGACTTCFLNSHNGLFPDGDPLCSNGSCFAVKTEEWRKREVQKGLDKHPDATLLGPYDCTDEGMLAFNDWLVSDESNPKSEIGIITYPDMYYNCPKVGCIIRFVRRSSSYGGSEAVNPADAKAKRKADLKAQRIEQRYRFRLYEAILPMFEQEADWQGASILPDAIRIMLIALTRNRQYESSNGISAEYLVGNNIEPAVEESPLWFQIEYAFRLAVDREVKYHDYNKSEAPVLTAFADFFGIDAALIHKEAEIELMSKKERKEAGLG